MPTIPVNPELVPSIQSSHKVANLAIDSSTAPLPVRDPGNVNVADTQSGPNRSDLPINSLSSKTDDSQVPAAFNGPAKANEPQPSQANVEPANHPKSNQPSTNPKNLSQPLITIVTRTVVHEAAWCRIKNVAFHRNQSHRHKVPTYVLTTNETDVKGCMDWYQTEAVQLADLGPLHMDPGYTALDDPVAIVDSEVFGWHAGTAQHGAL